MQGSGADVFLIAAVPKFAAQAIRKSYDLGWNAARYVSYVSASIAAVLKPAGLDKSKGLITATSAIDVTDPRWRDNPDVMAWKAFTDKYMSATEFADVNAAEGFSAAAMLVQVLKQCGSDLSRDNIMRQAANLKDFHCRCYTPGIVDQHFADKLYRIRQLQLMTFNGERWEPFGELEG